ncbi:15-cis-zeta-carotene isomerase, chloroplastic [Ricinus communis]|uniref:15-cis-zeta-carotene isomerase, chloroplastic n=1 Tax=Ricinus communis TaxID=3988 RepID=UPI00201AA529|nr:15-cis-zeta-carotene isomerase, chloroplastic [Ricinus communis]
MASSLILSNSFSSFPRRFTSNPTQLLLATSIPTFQNQTKYSISSKFLRPNPNSVPFSSRIIRTQTSIRDADTSSSSSVSEETVVGEDSAAFELGKQKMSSWIYFSVILGVALYVLDVAWIDNSTGFGKSFIQSVSTLSESHEAVMLILIFIFATVHSGLASLRDKGEELIGERAYRVLFAGVSLPLAMSTVVYFINHRYDGVQLWQLQSAPAVHQLVWLFNFISFFFLYPSTFNLLEVAAVDKPKMHLWETGIMRITRHPQMVGQVIWCLAHTIWIGNSVAAVASIGLVGHHLFGVWNGDRRLAKRYGEAFEVVRRRTSIVPFAAILDGRQELPKDYIKEFVRLPYFSITALTLGAYFAHPLMQAASSRLQW